MRKLFLIFFGLLSMVVLGQSKLDLGGQDVDTSSSSLYAAMIEVTDDANIDSLNVEVVSRIGNILVVNIAGNKLEEVAAMPQVKKISLSREVNILGSSASSNTPMVVVNGATVEEKACCCSGSKEGGKRKAKNTASGGRIVLKPER